MEIEYDVGELDEDDDIDDSEEFGSSITIYVFKTMKPHYQSILDYQSSLSKASKAFNGELDGWGVVRPR